jgi:hypothetical protein
MKTKYGNEKNKVKSEIVDIDMQGRSHIGDIGGTCLHYILEANYFSSVHPREMI